MFKNLNYKNCNKSNIYNLINIIIKLYNGFLIVIKIYVFMLQKSYADKEILINLNIISNWNDNRYIIDVLFNCIVHNKQYVIVRK